MQSAECCNSNSSKQQFSSLFAYNLSESLANRRAEQNRTRNAAKKTYVGSADTAVLILLKGRGSGLGSLNELKLALTARHTRGLRHLDDVLLPKSIGEGKRSRVGDGDRVAKQENKKGLLARCSCWPQERWSKKGRKKGQQRWGCCSISSTRIGTASNWDLLSQSVVRISALFSFRGRGKKSPLFELGLLSGGAVRGSSF